MPLSEKEKKASYDKKRYEKNKEKRLQKQKKRREDPEYKAQQAAYHKKRREDPEFREKEAAYQKQYRQTPECKKSIMISTWKRRGVICDDWDTLYERYLNTELCELCDIELTIDRYNTPTTRCLDHDHKTGLFRNVLCNSCNVKIG